MRVNVFKSVCSECNPQIKLNPQSEPCNTQTLIRLIRIYSHISSIIHRQRQGQQDTRPEVIVKSNERRMGLQKHNSYKSSYPIGSPRIRPRVFGVLPLRDDMTS